MVEETKTGEQTPKTVQSQTNLSVSNTALSSQQQNVSDVLNSIAEGKDDINPFVAVALLLKSMRESMETVKYEGQPPRWIRIARASNFKDKPIGKGVITISGAFLKAIGLLAELTLKAQDLLEQIDSGRALLEVGAKMIETVLDDNFLGTVQRSVGIEPPTTIPGTAVAKEGVQTVMKYMKYVPDPEDIKVVSQEMFKLLAIGTKEFVETEDNSDLVYTGKIRLLSWCLGTPIPCHGLSDGVAVNVLGISSSKKITAANKYTLSWKSPESDFNFCDVQLTAKTAGAAVYPEELTDCLNILKFLKYAADIESETVKSFQTNNKIDVTGVLDISTINRLCNLDYENKILKRAKSKTV